MSEMINKFVTERLLTKKEIRIDELEKQNFVLLECLKKINRSLVCIGGPLNDNIDKYNKKQLQFLFTMNRNIEEVLGER